MTSSILPPYSEAVVYVKSQLPDSFKRAAQQQFSNVQLLPFAAVCQGNAQSVVYFVDIAFCATETQREETYKRINGPVIFVNFGDTNWVDDALTEYCYLNWQTERESLHLKTSLAIFKSSYLERGKAETSLLTRAISCVGNLLIYLDEQGQFQESNQDLSSKSLNQDLVGKPIEHIIQVQRKPLKEQFFQIIKAAITTSSVTKLQPMSISMQGGEYSLFDGLVGPIEYPDGSKGAVLILREVENLTGVEDVLTLNNEQSLPLESNQTRCVLLINPDNFKNINHQYGWQKGDEILTEVEARLNKILRVADISARYIGAFFLVLLNDTSDIQTYNLINQLKLELSQKKYLNDRAQLNFSFGFAINDQEDKISLIELFYCANTALSKAIEFGGNQSIQWQQPSITQQIGNFDRINGDFLSDGLVNYRNILTLWEQLNTIVIDGSRLDFIEQLNRKLLPGLDLDATSFLVMEKHQLHFVHGINQQQQLNAHQVQLQANEQHFIEQYDGKGINREPFFASIVNDKLRLILPVLENDTLLAVSILTSTDLELATAKNHNLLAKLVDYIRVSLQKIEFNDTSKNNTPSSIEPPNNSRFWYHSKVMETLMSEVNMVAKTDATVLINGESGTGKEFLARTLHDLSERQHQPFVIFDCSTIVESLLESELFGHSKGAFTGADKPSQGCISQAEGGTLFLDEIGELAPETQMKLLRFIQEKQYSPVGSAKYHDADVRIISATNVNLKQRLEQGLFREDLYYRLNVFSVETPPLRERQEDILLLATNFLTLFANKYQKAITGFTKQAQVALTQYQWPGNVRELKNLIHKACILCQNFEVECSHIGLYPEISDEMTNISTSNNQPAVLLGETEIPDETDEQLTPFFAEKQSVSPVKYSHLSPMLDEIVDEFEQRGLLSIQHNVAFALFLEKCLYNYALHCNQQVVLQAANQLNISETTLRRHLRKHLNHTDTELSVFSRENIDKLDVFIKGIYEKERHTSKPLFMRNMLVKSCLSKGFTAKKTATILGVSTVTLRKIMQNTSCVKQ